MTDSCHVFSITRIWAQTDLKTWHSNIFSVLHLPLKFYPNLVIFQSVTAPHLMIRVWSDKYSEIVTEHFSTHVESIESPPLTWGVGSVTNFITYINVVTKLNLKRNKKPWRAHCKISYHHIIYFTNTTKVNCNVWNQSDQNSSHLHWSENDLTARFPLVSLYKSKNKIFTLLKISPQVHSSIRQTICLATRAWSVISDIWTL